MTSISSRPLPHLPLETQAHILRFCDRPTLAVSSRVSLAWLELAGPILYEHITISGKEQLEMMIRSESVLASIAPFVSLDQTKMFTYILAGARADVHDVSQKLASSAVLLDSLVLDLRESPRDDWILHKAVLDVFLASFDPSHIHVHGSPSSTCRFDHHLQLSSLFSMPRLLKITFNNALTSLRPLVQGRASSSPLLDLELDISVKGPSEPKWSEPDISLEEVSQSLSELDAGNTDHPAFGHVQVWMADDDEVALAKKKLIDCSCTSLDIGLKTPAHA